MSILGTVTCGELTRCNNCVFNLLGQQQQAEEAADLRKQVQRLEEENLELRQSQQVIQLETDAARSDEAKAKNRLYAVKKANLQYAHENAFLKATINKVKQQLKTAIKCHPCKIKMSRINDLEAQIRATNKSLVATGSFLENTAISTPSTLATSENGPNPKGDKRPSASSPKSNHLNKVTRRWTARYEEEKAKNAQTEDAQTNSRPVTETRKENEESVVDNRFAPTPPMTSGILCVNTVPELRQSSSTTGIRGTEGIPAATFFSNPPPMTRIPQPSRIPSHPLPSHPLFPSQSTLPLPTFNVAFGNIFPSPHNTRY